METLAIALGALIFYLLAYYTYGSWLAKKIFRLRKGALVPSKEFEDGQDFVPSKKFVIFGHHFTSIAGTGPIVGPAIAVFWGWLPALLWVLLGSVFIGAVHDFGALVVSLRNQGKTVGDIAGKVLNNRVRFLFLIILFLALTIVLAIFGLVIASVFKLYPQAISPCLIQVPLAIIVGLWLHRKGKGLLIPSIICLILMYLSVYYGDISFFKTINNYLSNLSIFTWVIILLFYSYIASVLPVWVLLQPRDFINSLQLITALALVFLGIFWASFFGGQEILLSNGEEIIPKLKIIAPAFRLDNLNNAPPIFPFLFITIACGAISGFHCLVSSGTSSKQLNCEPDAKFVAYGSMLTEGFLAVIVILACVAGLGLGIVLKDGNVLHGSAAYAERYGDWLSAKALSAKLAAFVDGSANFIKSMGIAGNFALALMGVLVASFAATTLDTACRLQRYVVQEIANGFSNLNKKISINLKIVKNKHGATIFAVLVALLLAALPKGGEEFSWANAGKGGLILWQMFGATNQLLAGLAFLVIVFWLKRNKIFLNFLIFPMLFMLIMPCWAMLYSLFFADSAWIFSSNKNYALIIIAICTIILEFWLIFESILIWKSLQIQSKTQ